MDGEELLAQVVNVMGKQLIQIVMVTFSQPVSQGLELERFSIIVAAGMDEPGEVRQATPAYRLGR